jgi:hypothetical protein
MTNYLSKLRDPRWQKKRLEIMQRDNFTCQSCGEKEKPLHVHHRMYKKATEPWDYNGYLLITLCEECHGEFTEVKKEGAQENLMEGILSRFNEEDLTTLACALAYHELDGDPDESAYVIEYALTNRAICGALKHLYQEGIKERRRRFTASSKKEMENA